MRPRVARALVAAAFAVSCARRAAPSSRGEAVGSAGDTYTYLEREGTSSIADRYAKASELLAKGDVAGARKLYQEAIVLEPRSESGHVGLAACAMAESDWRAARRHYERATELAPLALAPHVGLGSVAFREGRYADACAHYERALSRAPDSADAHWGAAIGYDALGDARRAADHAQRFLDLAPGSSLAGRAQEIVARRR